MFRIILRSKVSEYCDNFRREFVCKAYLSRSDIAKPSKIAHHSCPINLTFNYKCIINPVETTLWRFLQICSRQIHLTKTLILGELSVKIICYLKKISTN